MHASEHHFVAERFFGRSGNGRGEIRDRIFKECPRGFEGASATYCYECHEIVLHNPVMPPGDVSRFREPVARRGLDESEKPPDLEKLGGRIRLLREVIEAGLESVFRKHLASG